MHHNSWHENNHSGCVLYGFRFSQEIISHAICLSFRFSLSFRDVEDCLAENGIIVSYETVRQ